MSQSDTPQMPFIEISENGQMYYDLNRKCYFNRTYELEDIFHESVDSHEVYATIARETVLVGFDANNRTLIEHIGDRHHIRLDQGEAYFEGDVISNQSWDADTRRLTLENRQNDGTFVQGQEVQITITLTNSNMFFKQFRMSLDKLTWYEFYVPDITALVNSIVTTATLARPSAQETYNLIRSLLNYNDLQNRPTIPAPRTAQEVYDIIRGYLDYNDLQNQPAIPSPLTIQEFTTRGDMVAQSTNLPQTDIPNGIIQGSFAWTQVATSMGFSTRSGYYLKVPQLKPTDRVFGLGDCCEVW